MAVYMVYVYGNDEYIVYIYIYIYDHFIFWSVVIDRRFNVGIRFCGACMAQGGVDSEDALSS